MATAPRIGFIGAGRTTSTLAPAFDEAGFSVQAIASRTGASAKRLASVMASTRAVDSLQELVDGSDLIILAVPDDALMALDDSLRWQPGQAVVHTSGALSSAVMRKARQAGAATGSLHPLLSFSADQPVKEDKYGLRDATFVVEADGDLRILLAEIVTKLSGKVIELSADEKALYHTSAVLASNYVVTLMDLAAGLWQRFHRTKPEALAALLPLLRTAVANLETQGLPRALTGPVSRGDLSTVRLHLERLDAEDPRVAAIYRTLGEEAVSLAVDQGGISGQRAAELRDLLHDNGLSAHEAVAG